MKTLFVTIGGTVTARDIVIINYRHRIRGGSNGLVYQVKENDTPATITQGLLAELNQGRCWPAAEFQGLIDANDPNVLIIKGEEKYEFADVEYSTDVEGAKTETITLKVV